LAGGKNTYGYVLQNPLFWIDPSGLKSKPFGLDSAKKFANDMGAESIGKMLGPICGANCTQMRNPRRNPEEVATDLCNELLLHFPTQNMQAGAAALQCRLTCLEVAKEKCDKKPGACLDDGYGQS
jgi:hypothetical protein